jgi:electron-transferring-flavoprotein dehydrogenase
MTTPELPAREAMEFDTVIVGAGPAGLAAAIRLKQVAPDSTVVVVEKGSEVGAHILSGAVIDPIGLDRLIPEWRGEDTPIKTAVTADHFYALGPSGALRLPNFLLPPLMSNHGKFIVSLSGEKGRSARRRNLSGLCRRRSAVREWCRRRHRHRRHGCRQGREP